MFDEFKNLNIETCSDTELKALIRKGMPMVITIFRAIERVVAEEEEKKQLPCDGCEKRDTCENLCERVESMLPGPLSGDYVLNNTYGDMLSLMSDGNDPVGNEPKHTNKLKTVDIPKPEAMFRLYEGCQNIFTEKQWRLVYLKFKEGMQNNEIAEALGMTQSSVSDMLKRAKQRMEQHYRNRRKSNT